MVNLTAIKLLTVTEVARILRVDDTTVRRWIVEGGLPAISLPGRRPTYRIKETTLSKMLEDQNTTAVL